MDIAVKLCLRVLPPAINSLYCWPAAFPGGCWCVHCKILAVRSCYPDNSSFNRRALSHRYPFVIVASRFLQNGKLIILTTWETLGVWDMSSCGWQRFSSLELSICRITVLGFHIWFLIINIFLTFYLFPWILEEINHSSNGSDPDLRVNTSKEAWAISSWAIY